MNETQKIEQTIATRKFTPHDVALWFFEQSSDTQAWFLNYILSFMHSSCASIHNGDFQMLSIAKSAALRERTYLIDLAERLISPRSEP